MSKYDKKPVQALTYPLDLTAEANSTYFKIQEIRKEQRPPGSRSIFNDSGKRTVGDVFGENSTERILGSIFLPMPLGIADGNNAAWGDSKFNFLEDIAGSAIGDFFGQLQNDADPIGALQSSGNTALQQFGNALQNEGIQGAALDAITASIIKGFGSTTTVNQQLSRTSGKVINSNLELLFDGPALRNHEFTFKLTPRSKKESDTVKKIIFQLKKGMAPRAGETNAFLQEPSVYKIGFRQGGKDHPFLFSMKTCAMKSLNVNYSASTQENYSSYFDGTPTSLDLSLSFTELTPVYADDYDEFEDLTRGVGW